jgi:hypothetical protein
MSDIIEPSGNSLAATHIFSDIGRDGAASFTTTPVLAMPGVSGTAEAPYLIRVSTMDSVSAVIKYDYINPTTAEQTVYLVAMGDASSG